MNLEWISQKGAGLTALVVGLIFGFMAFFDSQYRYFYLCIAVLALIYGYKKLKKQDTPFQRRERELRRKNL
jgi:4-hydroxybenzoate polyprenyltransferase